MSRAERAALSDEKLVQAAVELIIELGVERVTLRAIGDRAGYSRGLVNYRFGTKDALLQEAVRRLLRSWSDRVLTDPEAEEALEASEPSRAADAVAVRDAPDDVGAPESPASEGGIETIRRYVMRHAATIGSTSHEFLAYTRLVHASFGTMPEIREDVVQVQKDVRERIVGWIETGKKTGEIRAEVDAEAEATWIHGATRGLAVHWMLDPEGVPLERSYRALADAIERKLVAG